MIEETNSFISCLNWQGIVAVFVVTWLCNYETRKSIREIQIKLEKNEDRIFQLATAKTIAQGILEERMKEEK